VTAVSQTGLRQLPPGAQPPLILNFSAATMTRPEILADVASITRGQEMQVVSHYNIRRVVDIYGAVQDRDLRAGGRDIARI